MTQDILEQPIILASASPRRRELFAYTGLPFEAIAVDADESATGEGRTRVASIAERKARAAARLYPNRLILAADTLVQVNGCVLGKPASENDAFDMLSQLCGQWHEVFTGICLYDGRTGQFETSVDETKVKFAQINETELRGYIRSGEPMDKAGAYAVQGRGGLFVEALEGSYSNVIGLPLSLLRERMKSFWHLAIFDRE